MCQSYSKVKLLEWTCLILSEIPSFLCVVCKIHNIKYKQCFEQSFLVRFSVGSLRAFFVQGILTKTGHAENHQEKKLLLENFSDSKLLMAQSPGGALPSWTPAMAQKASTGYQRPVQLELPLLVPCLVFLVHAPWTLKLPASQIPLVSCLKLLVKFW